MKLQEKTSIILVLLLILILGLISIFVSAVSLSSYRALEEQYLLRDIDEIADRLQVEFTSLSLIASDWGKWDDTFEFVNGNKPDYVSTNLAPGILSDLRIDFIVITNKNGDVVFSGAYDVANQSRVPVTDALRRHLVAGSPLLNTTDPQKTTSGILVLDGKPMVVASSPIIHSDLTGTPQGVVIMGRYLESYSVSPEGKAGKPAQKTIRFIPAYDPSISPEVLSSLENLNGEGSGIAVPLENDLIAGYALIRDVNGSDALVLVVQEHRMIFEQGLNTTKQYILIVLAAGLLLGVFSLFTLDRLVLAPVTTLSRQVREIGRQTPASGRVSIGRSDEFSGLSQEINRMLETIEETHAGLVQSETRFRELADLLPLPVFEIDLATRFLYTNEAGTAQFGITGESIQKGITAVDFLIASDIERMQQGLLLIRNGAKSSGEIYTLRQSDGSLMRAIVYIAPIQRDGAVTGFRGVLINVTDRLNLEEALTESQEYLSTLLMSVSVGILVIDAKTHLIVDVNPAALEMIGTTRDNVIDHICHDLICPAEIGKCPITDLGLEMDNAQRTLLTSDGRKVPIIKHVVPVMLHGRSCLLETFIDNTARVQIEDELQESRERLASILQASPVGVFETKANGALRYVNERWEEMTGLTLETVRQREWTDIHEPLDKARISKSMWKKFQASLQPHAEFRFMRPDGAVIWIFGQSVPIYDQKGQVQGYVGTITDITDHKRIEEAIHLANKKLNLMNDITRHDILNTITGIFGLIDMAVASGNKDELAELLSQIKEEGRLIQRQITFTRDYQGVGVNAPVWQNVREVASRATANLDRPGVTIAIEVEDTEIFADPLLEKVFYNLVDNALRYGEHVTIIRFFYQISDIGLALICEDNGVGILEDAKEHIFERGVGKNTGMGLFLTREILRITGIVIRETGIPGEGARFEMPIPKGLWRFVQVTDKR
jgi:PAS domain S-box-containing protein